MEQKTMHNGKITSEMLAKDPSLLVTLDMEQLKALDELSNEDIAVIKTYYTESCSDEVSNWLYSILGIMINDPIILDNLNKFNAIFKLGASEEELALVYVLGKFDELFLSGHKHEIVATDENSGSPYYHRVRVKYLDDIKIFKVFTDDMGVSMELRKYFGDEYEKMLKVLTNEQTYKVFARLYDGNQMAKEYLANADYFLGGGSGDDFRLGDIRMIEE